MVRFSKERDAELAISKLFGIINNDCFHNGFDLSKCLFHFHLSFLAELKDGSRFDGRSIEVGFF